MSLLRNVRCGRNNAINKVDANYDASTNLISFQDLEQLMPAGWSLEENFYPYVRNHIGSAMASFLAGGSLPRRGFQLFGIDLMLVRPDDPRADPEIYLLEVNLRPKLDIPDEVSVEFQKAVKAIVDDVISCIEQHHFPRKKNESTRKNRFDEVTFDVDQFDLIAATPEDEWDFYDF